MADRWGPSTTHRRPVCRSGAAATRTRARSNRPTRRCSDRHREPWPAIPSPWPKPPRMEPCQPPYRCRPQPGRSPGRRHRHVRSRWGRSRCRRRQESRREPGTRATPGMSYRGPRWHPVRRPALVATRWSTVPWSSHRGQRHSPCTHTPRQDPTPGRTCRRAHSRSGPPRTRRGPVCLRANPGAGRQVRCRRTKWKHHHPRPGTERR